MYIEDAVDAIIVIFDLVLMKGYPLSCSTTVCFRNSGTFERGEGFFNCFFDKLAAINF
jgi:hypothetical protein